MKSLSNKLMFPNVAEKRNKIVIFIETFNRRVRESGYERYIENVEYLHGFSYIVFIMLLLGNYSIHSGNILVLLRKSGFQAVAIDYGAAFRNFTASLEQNDILQALEELQQEGKNLQFFKHYIENYKTIPGLMNSVSAHAKNFYENIGNSDDLGTIIQDSIQEVYGIYSQAIGEMSGNGLSWGQEETKLLSIFSEPQLRGELSEAEFLAHAVYQKMIERLSKLQKISDHTTDMRYTEAEDSAEKEQLRASNSVGGV